MSFFHYPKHILKRMDARRVLRLFYNELVRRKTFSMMEKEYIRDYFIENPLENISKLILEDQFFDDELIYDKVLFYIEKKLNVKVDECDLELKDGYNEIKKYPHKIVLHNLRSLHNVGSIIRSADCLGVEGIYLTGYTPYKENISTAMGSQSYVQVYQDRDVLEVINHYKKTHQILGIERCSNSCTLDQVDLEFPILSIFGNEKNGIPNNIILECDKVVDIPMWGYKHSMNVSNAFSIVGYELRRRYYSKSRMDSSDIFK